ncbi:MAG: Asp-tRNA(Asn)/Glu-tRNA(Gln) amidotransferase subunit GatC [Lachnospiraceae bacterium]|nr:Asp-tRNA(Asn)/Glu-tRNA(Gln) amidotransferase subunit GatC [Lachnospiraceae bacterium]
MPKIDDTVIEQMEVLAKLSVSGEERKKVIEEMEKILTYVEKLNELDTDGIEPLVHSLPEVNVFREDTVVNTDGRNEALLNAPRQKDGQYVVPKTV